MNDSNDTLEHDETTGHASHDHDHDHAGHDHDEHVHHLSLDVEVTDVGPCRKHVRVRIPEADVNHMREHAIEEVATTAAVPGFRVGHVPKKLLQKRFKDELSSQLKQKLLMESMEQLAQENELDPINEPDIDVATLDVPETGDFQYEFDVEVRPEFSVPAYEGLTITKPVREISETDIDEYLNRYLSQYSQRIESEVPAVNDDFLVLEARFTHQGKELKQMERLTVRLKPVLRFQDAEIEQFGELLSGTQVGDERDVKLKVSLEAEDIAMRGEEIDGHFKVLEVRGLRVPELTPEFLERIGYESIEQLRDEIRQMLERQLTFEQRQSARSQVLEKITDSAQWELPEQLVLKHVENALRREILEMQQAGYTTEQIRARENEMRQQAVTTTRQALKEHFVLDKVATTENIGVTHADIDIEIRLMAQQRGENPRRVRARLQKTGMIENLEAQIRERKAIDAILDRAVFEEVPAEKPQEDRISAIAMSICGGTTVVSPNDDSDDDNDE
ncbi:MAG: trigger factor [Planctomycetota bacterium]|nr:trigger factor [Planctomycetota bacterium]MDA1211939.1 trigger factor [Planctomycetota bacterium]